MQLIKLLIEFLLLHCAISEDSDYCSYDSRCNSDCNALSNCCFRCKCRSPVKYQKNHQSYGCSTSKCASISTSYCQNCVDGYYLKEQVCYFCKRHCVKCSSYDVCTQCESQYTLVNSQCKSSNSIPLCVTIYDSNKCSQCVSNAEQYNSNKSCKCKDGYIQDDDSCKQCLTICDQCNGAYNVCQACKSVSYMNVISNGVCTCQDQYYWDGSSCSPCFSECLKCEDQATQCTDCQAGLQLNDANQCVCESGTFQSTLIFPYGCQPCSKNCYYCAGTINDCTQCYQNYVLNSATKKCECPIGFFEINYECIQCTWPCVQCTSLSSCQLCDQTQHVITINQQCFCQDGYYINLDDKTCSQCNFNCKTCKDQPKYCLSCFDGYVMTPMQSCLKCGIKASITYEICQYKDCSDGVWSYGDECDDGNQINRDGCQNCQIQESFYCINVILQPSQCFRCMDNCIKCAYNNEKSQIECQKALSGYYISNLTEVQKCSDKCLECDLNQSQCLACRFLNVGKEKLDCQLCEYKDGYYSNFEEKKCFTKCGDSIKADIEECDDGNIENGDGCDKFCKLEKAFNCQNGICNKLQLPEPLGFENQIFDLYTPQRQVVVYYQQLLNLKNNFLINDIIKVDLIMMEENVTFTYSIVQNLDLQQTNQFNLSYAVDIFVNQSISNSSVLITYLQPQNIRNIDNQEQILTQINIPITKVIVISQAAKQLTQNSVSTSNYLIYILIGLLITGVLFGGLDIYFNLIDTIQYISYLYYINTIFPFNVNYFFENLNFAQFTIVQDFINLDEIINVDIGYDLEIHSKTVPFKIKDQGFYSCFLLNFASIFSVFVVSFCFFILAQLIYSKLLMFKDIDKQQLIESNDIQDKKIKLMKFISKIKHSLLTWCITVLEEYFFSDILRIFMTAANEYCFIVNLGFKGLDFQTNFGIINSMLTFFSFGFYLIITYCSFALVGLKSYAMETKSYQKNYGSIIEGMAFQRYSKYFNPILLIKKFLFMLFLVQLYDCPIIQASQVLILNLSVLIYMIIYLPISDKLELRKQIICEASQTITIMIFSLFCINDQLEILNDEQKLRFGWLVIANVLMALVTQVVINIILQWQYLHEKYKFVQQIVQKVKSFWRKCSSKENPSITLFV